MYSYKDNSLSMSDAEMLRYLAGGLYYHAAAGGRRGRLRATE